jgi:hypothetical protein
MKKIYIPTYIPFVRAEPYGELLRLIFYEESDEFLFSLLQRNSIGWNIGNSSPCYSGTEDIINLIKGYEYTSEVVDLLKYPLKNSGNISIVSDEMKISSVTAGEYSGVSSDDTTKKIKIHPSVDYEISFRVRKDYLEDDVSFGVTTYNESGSTISNLSNIDGSESNWFFQDLRVCKLVDTDCWVRGVIFNSEESNNSEDKLNIGEGNNLRFQAGAAYIIPNILIKGTVGMGDAFIYDIKVRPRALPYSQGSFGAKNIIIAYMKNNNLTITNEKAQKIIQKYLIPYNSTLEPVWLQDPEGSQQGDLLLNTGGRLLLNTGGGLIF